jgi:REP element-mobilizing transposase RayT
MDRFKGIYRNESSRLPGWDYSSPGRYYVTICTGDRVEWFGHVVKKEMKRNDIGNIAFRMLIDIPNHHNNASLDEFMVMPNHIHVIIVLRDRGGDGVLQNGGDAINRVPAPIKSRGGITQRHNPMLSRESLSYAVRWFKGRTSFEIRKNHPNFTWQSRFHDHIIRDRHALDRIRRYIIENPIKWYLDENNPDRPTE